MDTAALYLQLFESVYPIHRICLHLCACCDSVRVSASSVLGMCVYVLFATLCESVHPHCRIFVLLSVLFACL